MASISKRCTTLLQKLVAIKSISGNELAAAILLKQFFQKFNLEGQIDVFAPNSGNFMVSYLTNPSRRKLILCSHIDVVPAGELSFWQSNPFALTDRDGLWFGRGVCDAKGIVVAMALAFLAVVKQRDFNGNIIFLAVAGEEKGGIGAKRFIERYGDMDGCAIIGEPTRAMVNTSQKGRIEFVVDVIGVAGHAARPQEKSNAVLNAAELLQQLRPYLAYTKGIGDAATGKASLAITLVNTGGNSANSIPGVCRLTFDRRWIYSEDPKDIINGFTNQITDISGKMGIKTRVKAHLGIPAVYTDSDAKISQCAVQACAMVKKEEAKTASFPAGCDMYVFTEAGFNTVILGSGDLFDNRAHGYNEFIDPQDLAQIINIYTQTINNYFK